MKDLANIVEGLLGLRAAAEAAGLSSVAAFIEAAADSTLDFLRQRADDHERLSECG